MSARYMEAFLEREQGRYYLSGSFCFIEELSDSPRMRSPRAEEAAEAHNQIGELMGRHDASDYPYEGDAVVAMYDQDRRPVGVPRNFRDWLQRMKPGGSLTFVHEDGGQLLVQGVAHGPYLLRFSDAQGRVVAEGSRVSHPVTCQMIDQYFDAEEVAVITSALGPG
jgi:hypothetical protein